MIQVLGVVVHMWPRAFEWSMPRADNTCRCL